MLLVCDKITNAMTIQYIHSYHITIPLSSHQPHHHVLRTYWSPLSFWSRHTTLPLGRSLILGEEPRIILQLFLHNVKTADEFAFEVKLWECGPIGLPTVSYDFQRYSVGDLPRLSALAGPPRPQVCCKRL